MLVVLVAVAVAAVAVAAASSPNVQPRKTRYANNIAQDVNSSSPMALLAKSSNSNSTLLDNSSRAGTNSHAADTSTGQGRRKLSSPYSLTFNATGHGRGRRRGRRKLSTHTLMFSYSVSVQQWVVPSGLDTFTVEAYGAAGADADYISLQVSQKRIVVALAGTYL